MALNPLPDFNSIEGEEAKQLFYDALCSNERFFEAAARYLDRELLGCLLLLHLTTNEPLVIRVLRDLDRPDVCEVLREMKVPVGKRSELAEILGVSLDELGIELPPYRISNYSTVLNPGLAVTTP